MFNLIKMKLEELHHDERGEMPIGPILLIALIVIPLVFFLITFRDQVLTFLSDAIETIFGEAADGNETEAPPIGG